MQKQFKFKNYLVFIILLVVLAAPSFVLAAWWNPFSWGIWNRFFHFQKVEQKQEQQIKKDETAGWKTYKNDEYGYEIKYPQNWIADVDLLSHMNGGEGSVVFCPPELQSNGANGLTGKNGNCIVDKTLGGSINPKAPIILRQCDYYVKNTDCLKDSNTVKFFKNSNDGWGYNLLVVNTKYQNVFNQIISTLKFTNPIVVTDNDCVKSRDVNYYETYRCGDIIFSYEKNPQLQCSRCVTAYLSNGDKKTELIHQVSVDCCGGGVPEFQKTSEDKIVLLYTNSGDLGFASHENYYININTRKVLGISWYSNSEDSGITIYKDVNDKNNTTFEIKALTENHCKDKNYAILKDLMVNGIPQNSIKQPITLLCSPQFTGNVPEFPLLDLKDVGITKDLSKAFFTVSETDWKDGVGEIPIFKYNYSFNLTSKIIVEENPENLLKIVN